MPVQLYCSLGGREIVVARHDSLAVQYLIVLKWDNEERIATDINVHAWAKRLWTKAEKKLKGIQQKYTMKDVPYLEKSACSL